MVKQLTELQCFLTLLAVQSRKETARRNHKITNGPQRHPVAGQFRRFFDFASSFYLIAPVLSIKVGKNPMSFYISSGLPARGLSFGSWTMVQLLC
jgi:hypothetical protein